MHESPKNSTKLKDFSAARNYWCAPRKVSGTNTVKIMNDPKLKTDRRKPRKKLRQASKKLRRIDVLAQPKLQSQRKRSPSAPRATRNVRSQQLSTMNGKEALKSSEKTNKSATIALSKKLQRRLFSLVCKRIKELAESGKI